MQQIYYVLLILLFIVIFYFVNTSLQTIEKNRAIEKSFAKLFNFATKKTNTRKEIEEAIMLEDGNTEKTNLFYKFDLMLERTGIKKHITFLNTEVFLVLVTIISIATFLIASTILSHWIFGVIASMIIAIGMYSILYFLSGVNYEKVEEEITTFVNMLENYSSLYDDIVTIMRKTSYHLKDPLRTYVESFCDEAEFGGDVDRAFRNLITRLENPRFKTIVRNISICSKYEANYKEIVKDERRSLRVYQSERRKRKEVTRGGRVEVGITILFGIYIISMFTSFVPDLYNILLTSFIGNLLLLYVVVVLGFATLTLVTFDKN